MKEEKKPTPKEQIDIEKKGIPLIEPPEAWPEPKPQTQQENAASKKSQK